MRVYLTPQYGCKMRQPSLWEVVSSTKSTCWKIEKMIRAERCTTRTTTTYTECYCRITTVHTTDIELSVDQCLSVRAPAAFSPQLRLDILYSYFYNSKIIQEKGSSTDLGGFMLMIVLRCESWNHHVGDIFNLKNQSPTSQIGN